MDEGSLEISDEATDEQIIKALVNAGHLREKCLAPGYMKVDGSDGLLFIDRASDDFPALQLEEV
jgi:hypothetical protein